MERLRKSCRSTRDGDDAQPAREDDSLAPAIDHDTGDRRRDEADESEHRDDGTCLKGGDVEGAGENGEGRCEDSEPEGHAERHGG